MLFSLFNWLLVALVPFLAVVFYVNDDCSNFRSVDYWLYILGWIEQGFLIVFSKMFFVVLSAELCSSFICVLSDRLPFWVIFFKGVFCTFFHLVLVLSNICCLIDQYSLLLKGKVDGFNVYSGFISKFAKFNRWLTFCVLCFNAGLIHLACNVGVLACVAFEPNVPIRIVCFMGIVFNLWSFMRVVLPFLKQYWHVCLHGKLSKD